MDVFQDAIARVERIGKEARMLSEVMTRAFDAMWQVHEQEGQSLRSAAYSVAMRRIAEGLEAHETREYFQKTRV